MNARPVLNLISLKSLVGEQNILEQKLLSRSLMRVVRNDGKNTWVTLYKDTSMAGM